MTATPCIRPSATRRRAMDRARRTLGVAVVALTLPTACAQDVELWPVGADADVCAPLGATCGAATECCSARCRAGVCAPDACATAGATCTSGRECCSGVCRDTCAAATDCAPAGETCTVEADCCSRACAAGPEGRPVCQSLGGCRQAGELCLAGIECCGGTCDVFDPALGLGHCAPTEGCGWIGEVCRVDGTPIADRPCCTTGAPPESLCRASDVGGVRRCVTEAVARSECLADGALCATPIDCCGGSCAPGPTGVLTCSTGCAPQSGDCSRDADCCDGACNSAGRCTGSSACAALSARCTADADCCSAVCGADGRCAPGLF